MTATPYSPQEFLSLIFSSKAVSIWNHETGPVFWYAAGVPGPFYVNTEKLIGATQSADLLEAINGIVGDASLSSESKSEAVREAVLKSYRSNDVFQRIVATMIETSPFPINEIDLISGGERRDWFFSVPFAEELGLDHLYIFKNGEVYRRTGEKSDHAGMRCVHISDLINNAASYFDKWLPILADHKMDLLGTISVINRGQVGMDRLKEADVKVHTLKSIDLPLFAELADSGLIPQSANDEISLYFKSKEDWARQYILARPEVFGLDAGLDAKSKERLQSFLEQDPWGLEPLASETFKTLKAAL
ncbi:MAG TPA: hypothetical protein PLK94_12600 [Alphaproteobacteria bacterium]|nr:hypothetical protein [Alphaproteobacteria bacterium]HOO52120.1 hypothetical protein [Alphaproteobacteria bacterium]